MAFRNPEVKPPLINLRRAGLAQGLPKTWCPTPHDLRRPVTQRAMA